MSATGSALKVTPANLRNLRVHFQPCYDTTKVALTEKILISCRTGDTLTWTRPLSFLAHQNHNSISFFCCRVIRYGSKCRQKAMRTISSTCHKTCGRKLVSLYGHIMGTAKTLSDFGNHSLHHQQFMWNKDNIL
eukprot:4698506-Karenia_brevis.AAC.1